MFEKIYSMPWLFRTAPVDYLYEIQILRGSFAFCHYLMPSPLLGENIVFTDKILKYLNFYCSLNLMGFGIRNQN